MVRSAQGRGNRCGLMTYRQEQAKGQMRAARVPFAFSPGRRGRCGERRRGRPRARAAANAKVRRRKTTCGGERRGVDELSVRISTPGRLLGEEFLDGALHRVVRRLSFGELTARVHVADGSFLVDEEAHAREAPRPRSGSRRGCLTPRPRQCLRRRAGSRRSRRTRTRDREPPRRCPSLRPSVLRAPAWRDPRTSLERAAAS